MNELLFFIIGLVVGGLTGVTTMCLCIIAKDSDLELPKKKKENIENKTSKF